jgi:hypothetical protein
MAVLDDTIKDNVHPCNSIDLKFDKDVFLIV